MGRISAPFLLRCNVKFAHLADLIEELTWLRKRHSERVCGAQVRYFIDLDSLYRKKYPNARPVTAQQALKDLAGTPEFEKFTRRKRKQTREWSKPMISSIKALEKQIGRSVAKGIEFPRDELWREVHKFDRWSAGSSNQWRAHLQALADYWALVIRRSTGLETLVAWRSATSITVDARTTEEGAIAAGFLPGWGEEVKRAFFAIRGLNLADDVTMPYAEALTLADEHGFAPEVPAVAS